MSSTRWRTAFTSLCAFDGRTALTFAAWMQQPEASRLQALDRAGIDL